MGPYARVAVPRPVSRTFQYAIPDSLAPWVQPGVRCVVPFGGTRVAGFVVALDDTAEVDPLKSLLEVIDLEPCLPRELLDLGLWLSSYYHHPPGETLSSLLPPAFRAGAEPVYRLSQPSSAEALNDHEEIRLWERIRDRGEIPAAALRAPDFPVIDRLQKAGRIVRAWRVVPPSRLRGEEWFRLAPEAPLPEAVTQRAPRQAEVLESLNAGPLPSHILRARGVSRSALMRAVERGWLQRFETAPEASVPSRLPLAAEGTRLELTAEQTEAVGAAVRGLEQGCFTPILLQGVTGSGKTEVYIRAAEETLQRGRSALVLVPEISLTPQMLGRFWAAFRADVAVLHSGLSGRDRRLQWERVRRGEARVALGARSAVFAPLRRVGLVVVDEEHDGSYKQEEGLRYNAKHVALMRARASDAVAILGSATPDIETFWGAQTGRYGSVVLPRRVRAVSPPEVRIVDLRQEERRRRSRVLLSEPLLKTVEEALGRGEQALLFLNRRGFSPAFLCSSCGEAVYCRHCSIALTLHRAHGTSALLCHYCGNRVPPASKCPGCGSDAVAPAGAGTQKLVEAALQAWPAARILRLDRDTARKEGAAEVLGSFHKGEADVLVGTQMVAKGHHFPRLTVVGVVDADQSLHLPDFRAAERTFQLLTQVAGRAGREMLSGLALFQTRNPDHPVIRAAAAGDYEAFANEELEARREAGFPPFRRLGLVRVAARTEEDVRRAAGLAAAEARRLAAPNAVEVLGPAPAPIERIRAWWRFQVLLRAPGPEPGPLQRVLRQFLVAMAATARTDVRIHVDVDPVSML